MEGGEERALPDRRAQCLILSSVLPALIASTWMWSPARRCRPPAQTEPCESFSSLLVSWGRRFGLMDP